MRYETEIETQATPERVWAALVDVEQWPDRMASYTSVRRLDDGELLVGSRAEVEQPGLSKATYTVSELIPGAEFTWTSETAGVRTTARHLVLPRTSSRAAISLSVEQSGVLARPVGWLLGRKIRRFLTIEGAGLKAAAEAG